jgi:NarL family two-component system sensor histidine kinase YdfH
MKKSPDSRLHNVQNDPRLLLWFALFLMMTMYIWSFFLTPRLLKLVYLLPFTGLFLIHLFLHSRISWVEKQPGWLVGYTILQGILAFAITWLSGNVGMVFCLFMALVGELLAFYKITVRGLLATGYLLALAFTNFALILGYKQAGRFLLGTIPTIIFVGIYVILYTRQAEANARARELLAELEAANRQLTEYAARVEDLTIAAERQRMARELHDTLSQGLAGLILHLEAADAHLAANRPERARGILEQSREKARGTLREARQAIDDLRQPAGADLAEAAEQEAQRFTLATGIACEPLIELKAVIPEAAAETAFRAISEGLTNIARHARAKQVSLRLTAVGKELEIEMQDDGAGFDPQAVQPGHYGLLGMRERVRLAGGRLEIQSEAGKGTRLLIRFTLEDGNQTAVTGGGDTAGSSARIEETAGSDVKREQTA